MGCLFLLHELYFLGYCAPAYFKLPCFHLLSYSLPRTGSHHTTVTGACLGCCEAAMCTCRKILYQCVPLLKSASELQHSLGGQGMLSQLVADGSLNLISPGSLGDGSLYSCRSTSSPSHAFSFRLWVHPASPQPGRGGSNQKWKVPLTLVSS